jgi:hypothetical protein
MSNSTHNTNNNNNNNNNNNTTTPTTTTASKYNPLSLEGVDYSVEHSFILWSPPWLGGKVPRQPTPDELRIWDAKIIQFKQFLLRVLFFSLFPFLFFLMRLYLDIFRCVKMIQLS